jgi:hypothetical protein
LLLLSSRCACLPCHWRCRAHPPYPCLHGRPHPDAAAVTAAPTPAPAPPAAALAAEPYRIFEGLLIEDLQELADDIRGFKVGVAGGRAIGWGVRAAARPWGPLTWHCAAPRPLLVPPAHPPVLIPAPTPPPQELDIKEPLHVDFWGAMHTLAQEELQVAARRDAEDRALSRAGGGLAGAGRVAAAAAAAAGGGPGGRAAAMHPDVQAEIEALLSGQTHGELRRMEKEINSSLAAGEGDPDYWEAVLERLQVRRGGGCVAAAGPLPFSRPALCAGSGAAAIFKTAAAGLRLTAMPGARQPVVPPCTAPRPPGPSRPPSPAPQIHAARARLRELHADLLRRRIDGEVGRVDVAEIMGWAAEAAADDDEDAAAARRAAAAAALAAAEAAAAGGEEGGRGGGSGDEEGAPPAPGRVVVNDEEINLSDDEEDEAAAAAGEGAAAAAAEAGPSGRAPEAMDVDAEGQQQQEGEEPESPRARPQRFTGIGAEGGARDMRGAQAEAESDGRFSPPPVDPRRLEAGAVVVAEEDDARTLQLLREEVRGWGVGGGTVVEGGDGVEEEGPGQAGARSWGAPPASAAWRGTQPTACPSRLPPLAFRASR